MPEKDDLYTQKKQSWLHRFVGLMRTYTGAVIFPSLKDLSFSGNQAILCRLYLLLVIRRLFESSVLCFLGRVFGEAFFVIGA